jgi:hypothetical protein
MTPDLDVTKLVTGTLRVGETLKGPFVLTYLDEATHGIVAELDHINVPLPMNGRLFIGEKQALRGVAAAANELGLLIYSGFRL